MKSKVKMSVSRRVTCFILTVMLALSSCGFILSLSDFKPRALASTYYTINTKSTKQDFDGWGTSLCWWADAVGGWDMEGASGKTKREEVSDLIFGEDGLNLNIVRYNVPGGDNPDHTHMIDNRGLNGLKVTSESDYEWENGANQFWMLESAFNQRKDAGDFYLEAFSNSAPWWMTNTQCVSGGTTKADENLPRENYGAFAEYFADVVAYIETEMGIPVNSVEILNEPNSDYWGANGSQEGCKVTQGDSQSLLIKALYDEMNARGMLDDVMVTGCDETNPALAYAGYNALSSEAKNMLDKINYHIYQKSDADRINMQKLAYANGDVNNQLKRLWMSEICYGLADQADETDGDNHNTLTNIFDMTSDIYKDLYLANVNAWIIWQAMESDLSNRTYGHNYGLLHGVYQDVGQTEYSIDMQANAINRGDYYITKQYYAMGQYSRYIKAGYKILESPAENCVTAISPDGKTVVVVYANDSAEDKEINLYLKGFEGNKAKTVVTSATQNWEETNENISGSYYGFRSGARSITTVVIEGDATENFAEQGTYFRKFANSSTSLVAQFKLPSITDGSVYDFYWADNVSALPAKGGNTASVQRLTPSSTDAAITIKDQVAGKTYYGVLKRTVNGNSYYSQILASNTDGFSDEFTYLTVAGKTNKSSLFGTGLNFGANYGVVDQPFGEDSLSGKKWGYTTAATGEYNADELFGCLRYSDTEELEYKYQVEEGVSYSVLLAFYDNWGESGRSMELWVNGVNTSKSIDDTKSLGGIFVDDVVGVAEADGCYITLTLKKKAGSNGNPTVSLISIQEKAKEKVVFSAFNNSEISIGQGESIEAALPATVQLLTSKGIENSYSVNYEEIDYSSALNSGGGTILVKGIANDKYSFEFSVATLSATEKIYYYIDNGALNPNSSSLASFDIVKNSNPTLINKDALDKYASSTDDWGRLNGENSFEDNWANETNKVHSIIQGKYVTGSGADKQIHIQYRLPSLPKGDYMVVIGCDSKTANNWPSNNRGFTVKMGDTVIGTQNGGYSDFNEWIYAYNKADDSTVIFDMYTSGSSAANPILSYLIIKTDTNATPAPTVTTETYYYIDSGAINPSAGAQSAYDAVKNSNPTLINTDTLDRYATSTDDWGRLNGESSFSEYWANEGNKMWSITEGKYVTGSGADKQIHIQYRLPSLPQGTYQVLVGCDSKTANGWGSGNRGVTIKIGNTVLGTKAGGYTGENEWEFEYVKPDGATVIFDMYTSGENADNPLLSYIIINKVTVTQPEAPEQGEKPSKPDMKVSAGTAGTRILVTNLQEGALLVLTSESGMLIEEHTVVKADVDNGYVVELSNLKGIGSMFARQFKDGAISDSSIVELPNVNPSAPRLFWSADYDTITIDPKYNQIDRIAYRKGETGKWIDIKNTKFFRATENGTYYILLTTLDRLEIVEKIEITHVDKITMKIDNDLSKWTDEDLPISLDFTNSANAMQKVEIFDGQDTHDITGTFSSGKFTYVVTENGNFTVTATSTEGSVKTFDFAVSTIDRSVATLDCELVQVDGGIVAKLTTQSLGEVKYSYSANGGEFVQIYQTEFPVFKDGEYQFRLTNMVGKSVTVKVLFASDVANKNGVGLKVTEQSGQKTYSVQTSETLTNVKVVKLAGDDEEITVTDNKFVITDSGEYMFTAQKADGTIIAKNFYANVYKPVVKTGYDNTQDLLNLYYITLGFGIVAVLAAAGYVTFKLIVRRQKNGK